MGLGEIAAISAAVVWASSTLIYKRFSHHLSPLQLNVSKGVIASAIMLLILLIIPAGPLPQIALSWVWLIVSGILGIAIGDSAYFAALRNIGPARTLVIESLAPAIAGLLNIVLLGVWLNQIAWLGITITTIGVLIAIKPRHPLPKIKQNIYLKGIAFALLAASCQAAGIVMSKGAMNAEQIGSLWAAFIRLFSGTFIVACCVACLKAQSLTQAITLKGISQKQWLFTAVFFGTFIGVWLQIISVQLTDPAIAQTIFATAPLIVMTLGAINKEPVTKNMIIGGLMAFSGVALLVLG